MDSNRTALTKQLQDVMNMQYCNTTAQQSARGKDWGYTYYTSYFDSEITTEQQHYFQNQRRKIMNLIALGADPEVTNGSGETCLARALLYDDFETANYLLQKGANPNAKQGALFPLPLIYYVTRLDIAKLLVSSGLIIRKCSTLLHNSMSYRRPAELVAYYISCDADTCEQDEQGNTPLHVLMANMCDQFQAANTTESVWISKATHLLNATPTLLTIKNKQWETPWRLILCKTFPPELKQLVTAMCKLFRTYQEKNQNS